jgi:RNA polymerase sigma-70 factor (ECF subfamily)
MTWVMWSVNHQPSFGPQIAATQFAALLAAPLEGRALRRYQPSMQGSDQDAAPGTRAAKPQANGPDHAALLLRIARDQDRAAFGSLFGHFGPRVKSYLMKLGTEPATAEDLMQDVMLVVWRRAATYDPRQAGVATWIFTIARNKRIDVLRRGPRPDFDPNDPALVPDAPPAPDHEASAAQWEIAIAEAVAAMPREQAEIIRLAYFEDISHSDISAKLGVPLGTVKSRLRLAMARLRSRFADKV